MHLCISGFYTHENIHEHFLQRLIHTLPLKAKTCVRTMCKSYDLLQIVESLCSMPWISKQDSIRKTECIQKLNKQSPSSFDLFRLHQLFNQYEPLYYDPIFLKKKSRFSFVNPIFNMYPP